jgi:hypothetical protein
MDLGGQSTSRSSVDLIYTPFSGSHTELVSPKNGAIDHHVFIAVICHQMMKSLFDNFAFTPATQTPADILPASKNHAMECRHDSDAKHGF